MFKRKVISLLLVLLTVLSMIIPVTVSAEDTNSGSLVIIGGALDPQNEEIYNKFIELGGGAQNIRIGIIPAASATPVSSGEGYKADFIYYGVPEENIDIIPIATKDDDSTEDIDESTWSNNGFSNEIAESLSKYNAIFFTGGDQIRIINTLIDEKGEDSPALLKIREIYDNGGVLGGSSAGAAIMSDPMIGGGTSLGALTQGVTYEDNYGIEGDNRVFITKGLGFFENAITDQHFIKRGRLGRLITACFDQNIALGYGIDENTALIVQGNTVEVVGESGVIIVDVSMGKKALLNKGLAAKDIIIHYIEKGDIYNAITKEFTINENKDTTSGYEYYEGNSLNTNIFGSDSIKQALTFDLVDNTENEAIGVSFDLTNDTKGLGTKFVFRKGDNTEGFWGKIQGKESYAALNVYLDIVPIEISIKEIKVPKWKYEAYEVAK